MKFTFKGFRQFVEENEQKPNQNMDFFNALDDELNVSSKMLDKIYKTDPQVSANFSLYNKMYKTCPWKIIKFTEKGAVLKLEPQKTTKSYFKLDKKVFANKTPLESRTIFIPREKLQDFMNQGWSTSMGSATGGIGMEGGIS